MSRKRATKPATKPETRRPGESPAGGGLRQLRLIRGPRPDWSLDTRTRRIGSLGVAEAKAILRSRKPPEPNKQTRAS
ncbi:MAG: hypothetical protein M5T61_03965 [Acidimicrobiia bacterium]|nr:hypothetical protein [Acidimicrobiia bacterium]